MQSSNTLVVYYSRTGTTQKVAEAIARATGADIEALVDQAERGGAFGFLRSVYDAALHRRASLRPMRASPRAYDLVVIGTPDWGRSVASPIRTFLEEHRGALREVAFFLTDGESDHAVVFRDMASLCGREPLAKLAIIHDDVVHDRYQGRVDDFVRELSERRRKERPAAGAPEARP